MTESQQSAWIGWFPILFYTSLYIGEVYTAHLPSSDQISNSTTVLRAESDSNVEEGTRLGAQALFWSAVLALSANLLLPLCVRPPNVSASPTLPYSGARGWKVWLQGRRLHLSDMWTISHVINAICMMGTL